MSDYTRLLDATIQHLENLKSHGVRFVPVAGATLAQLKQPSAPVRPRVAESTVPRAAAPPVNRPAASAAPARPAFPQAPVSAPANRPAIPRPSAPAAIVEEPARSPEEKAAAMADLRQRVLACAKCPNLVAARNNIVFGVGDIHSDLMFVGEAPGADEDRLGEPFVGAAGQLLTKIITAMARTRQNVYIANILKCRPDNPGQGSSNRKPSPKEMQTCVPFLQEQIAIIRPKVIVALGATAMEGLMGATAGITRLRGRWHAYRGIPLMPTYHPAYLLYRESGSPEQCLAEKRKVWEDMLHVLEKLGSPISEKQRGFFLKK